MRTFKKYLYESLMSYDADVPANIKELLNSLVNELNFTQLQIVDDNDPNRFDIAKANEQLLIDSFNKNTVEYKALSSREYYGLTNNGTNWNSLSAKEQSTFDTENGDIVIVDENDKPVCFVDVKISKNELGVISLGSIANFNDDGYYICINKEARQVKFVSHKAVVKAVKENEDLLNPVLRGRYEGYPIKWNGKDLTSEYFVMGKTIGQIFK